MENAIEDTEVAKVHGQHFICLTCKSHISEGNFPPMSIKNNLQLFDLSSCQELKLTELENSIIALNIPFQKVFKLPKSRWPAMKDRTINIPIYESDVLKTITSLPRPPTGAGIIAVDLKRKLNYKNTYMTQYISVPKILKALATLKELENPYYQFIEINDQFEDDLKNQDLEGYKFIYPEDEVVNEDSKISHKSTDISTGCEEEEDIDSFENADFEEQYYQQNDPVKKWQFQYNKSTYFSHNYPEIDYKEVNIKRISVAPENEKSPVTFYKKKIGT